MPTAPPTSAPAPAPCEHQDIGTIERAPRGLFLGMDDSETDSNEEDSSYGIEQVPPEINFEPISIRRSSNEDELMEVSPFLYSKLVCRFDFSCQKKLI